MSTEDKDNFKQLKMMRRTALSELEGDTVKWAVRKIEHLGRELEHARPCLDRTCARCGHPSERTKESGAIIADDVMDGEQESTPEQRETLKRMYKENIKTLPGMKIETGSVQISAGSARKLFGDDPE